MEYTEINVTCNTSGGNPSDSKNYIYDWIYKPMYGATIAYIPVPSGKFFTRILKATKIHSRYSNVKENNLENTKILRIIRFCI